MKSSMKFGLFLSALVLGCSIGFAQLEPQYTQYMYNIGTFNPAYAGTAIHYFKVLDEKYSDRSAAATMPCCNGCMARHGPTRRL